MNANQAIKFKRLAGMSAIILTALLPFVISNSYYYDVLTRIAINAIVVLALNLLIGFTGQISIGHAGFFGIGAYVSTICAGRYDWSSLAAIVAGLTLSSTTAFVIARPILKLKGHYLGMATLGMGIIISIIINNESAYTGGADGMSVPGFSVFGWTPSSEREWYWLCTTLLAVMTITTLRIVNSPLGRALRAIDGSEVAAQVVGIDVANLKVRIFVFSAGVASLMGSLTAYYVGFITPGYATFVHSIEFMTMVVVGGMASIYGSIVGAALLTFLPQLLSTFEGWETMIFGAILTLTMIFMPKGIVPTLQASFSWKGSNHAGG